MTDHDRLVRKVDLMAASLRSAQSALDDVARQLADVEAALGATADAESGARP